MINKRKVIIKSLKNLVKTIPIERACIINNEFIISVKQKNLENVLKFLKLHVLLQFEILVYITSVDYPKQKHRFCLVYDLLSLRYNNRIRIKTFTNELLGANSCNRLFLSSNWYECEVWDMFGIYFYKNENIKRLLTDYGFNGFPLRKDFPLSGYLEIRYHEKKKKIISENLKLNQDYRTFNFLTPWETFS